MEADERTAKAAIYGMNRSGGRTRELEEAWIIQALVREDGLSQVGWQNCWEATRARCAGVWR
jgi:hypothetical protein